MLLINDVLNAETEFRETLCEIGQYYLSHWGGSEGVGGVVHAFSNILQSHIQHSII